MLRISKLADYATMIMVFCARDPAASYTAKKIATETFIQQPTVSKVLKLLAKHQLMISQRGMHGGYQLAKAATQITMADVVAAVDGQIALTECSQHDSHCELSKKCTTRQNWQVINGIIYQALMKISLADMLQEHLPLTQPAQLLTKH